VKVGGGDGTHAPLCLGGERLCFVVAAHRGRANI
jgi:hypothetical protein